MDVTSAAKKNKEGRLTAWTKNFRKPLKCKAVRRRDHAPQKDNSTTNSPDDGFESSCDSSRLNSTFSQASVILARKLPSRTNGNLASASSENQTTSKHSEGSKSRIMSRFKVFRRRPTQESFPAFTNIDLEDISLAPHDRTETELEVLGKKLGGSEKLRGILANLENSSSDIQAFRSRHPVKKRSSNHGQNAGLQVENMTENQWEEDCSHSDVSEDEEADLTPVREVQISSFDL